MHEYTMCLYKGDQETEHKPKGESQSTHPLFEHQLQELTKKQELIKYLT